MIIIVIQGEGGGEGDRGDCGGGKSRAGRERLKENPSGFKIQIE